MLEFIAADLIDAEQIFEEQIFVWHMVDIRMRGREIRCGQDCCSVASVESDPGIFPWIAFVCLIDDLGVGIDQKDITGFQMMGGTFDTVGTFAGDNVVNQIMITDSRTPLISRIAALAADIIDT